MSCRWIACRATRLLTFVALHESRFAASYSRCTVRFVTQVQRTLRCVFRRRLAELDFS